MLIFRYTFFSKTGMNRKITTSAMMINKMRIHLVRICNPYVSVRSDIMEEVPLSSDDLSYFLLVWNAATILQHFLFCKRLGIREWLHRHFARPPQFKLVSAILTHLFQSDYRRQTGLVAVPFHLLRNVSNAFSYMDSRLDVRNSNRFLL